MGERKRKANCPLWKAKNRRLSEAVKCGFVYFFVFWKKPALLLKSKKEVT